jgi:RNA polymerase sigma factor (sigma-70 family)
MLIELLNEYKRAKARKKLLKLSDAIVTVISPFLHLYISHRVPPAMVDDVLQETLIGIMKSAKKFEGRADAQFYAYCYCICRYKIADALRREGKIRQHEFRGEELWKAVLESASEWPLPETTREKLQVALAKLAAVRPPCLAYLLEHYIVGLTFAEMSKVFNFPSAAAARMATSRCLALARELAGS